MPDKQTYFGVYRRDGDGHPMALFTDGDEAQTWRKARPDAADMMVAETDGLGRNASVADHFEATAPETPAAPSGQSPEELQETLLRNQLRAEEHDRRQRERLRAEVVKELDAEERKEGHAAEVREPERAGRPAR